MLAHYGVNVSDGYNWTLLELKLAIDVNNYVDYGYNWTLLELKHERV